MLLVFFAFRELILNTNKILMQAVLIHIMQVAVVFPGGLLGCVSSSNIYFIASLFKSLKELQNTSLKVSIYFHQIRTLNFGEWVVVN